jgi:hypothetical protein
VEKRIAAGFKLCDEVERALADGDQGLAMRAAVRLSDLAPELDNAHPDGERVYASVVDMLGEALMGGDLKKVGSALKAIRVMLAEDAASSLPN